MAIRTIIDDDPQVSYYIDQQDHLWDEYGDYVAHKPMTCEERDRLRRWVSQGHSVYDTPNGESTGRYGYPASFVDALRIDLARGNGGQGTVYEVLYSPGRPDVNLWDMIPDEVRAYIRGLRNRIMVLESYINDFGDDAEHLLAELEEESFMDTCWCEEARNWPRSVSRREEDV